VKTPKVVIGLPSYNHAAEAREAIESILGQTYTDLAVVVVDDCSEDGTYEILQGYAAIDSRVSCQRNDRRVGMIENWRRAFLACRDKFPEAEFFSWGSDHDLWHPRWLACLVEAIDGRPDVVLAYPLNTKVTADGGPVDRKPWFFDTAGVESSGRRFTAASWKMSAGNMIYGLFRADAVQKAGVFRHVLVPDRLLLTELSLQGQFAQVRQVLWFRRWYGRLFSLGRQRASFFPGKRPLYAYVPWWISHAAVLFWILGVRGERSPQIGRMAGTMFALRCFAFGGVLHGWQSLRGLRSDLLEKLIGLRPYERKVRLAGRSIRRRGGIDSTMTFFKKTMGDKARRKTAARARKRVRNLAGEIVRRPGVLTLRALRAIPIVKNRAVPWLLRQEMDQIPSAPIAGELKRELERLQQTSGPIIIGPWVSEVGFELLYWIPFLNWATRTYGLENRRLIVVSRGGARPWYQHLTREYVDIFDLFSVREYQQRNEERWIEGGNQKQYDVTDMDREILDRAKAAVNLQDAEVLHPSLMYRLLRFYWYEKAAVGLLTKHTDYRRLTPVAGDNLAAGLPKNYIAVRFYFRPSFPDTPDNRRFATDVIRSLSRESPVVLLNTGLNLDDHEDLAVAGGMGIHRIDHLMTPERNLEVQTQVISRARAFVGTYGGLAYVGPFYGVPSIGFYSNESELVPAHLDVGWRLGRFVGTPAVTLDIRSAALLRTMFDGNAYRGAAMAHVTDNP